jgi:hypothetical protein
MARRPEDGTGNISPFVGGFRVAISLGNGERKALTARTRAEAEEKLVRGSGSATSDQVHQALRLRRNTAGITSCW